LPRGISSGWAPFQSRSGFSPCLDLVRGHLRRLLAEVSIPVWVFSLPRRLDPAWCEQIWSFNPGLGFLPASTETLKNRSTSQETFQSRSGFSPCLDRMMVCFDSDLVAMFQSRSGFSPCLDGLASHSTGSLFIGFNPGLGFLPASTNIGPSAGLRKTGFQSRSGFSPCLDGSARMTAASLSTTFQSRSGFSPCLDSRPRCNLVNHIANLFQSRSGFSPCLDVHRRRVLQAGQRVSIPVWVFSLPRRIDLGAAPDGLDAVSIPVWVFSLPRRYWCRWTARTQCHCFNPGLGFLPASTDRWRVHHGQHTYVSIPVWVFSLPRRSGRS